LRIFIGLREISGYFSKLNSGFQALGVDSTFVSLRGHSFRYGGSAEWPLVKAIQYCVKQYESAKVAKPFWGGAQLFLGALLLLWTAARYDVFIFGFGTSFLLLYDLPFLKWLGKKIIFVFLGSDARPLYLNGMFVGTGDRPNVERCRRATRAVKRRIATIERYADVIISLPTYGLFHEKPFVLHGIIGFPSEAASITAIEVPSRNPKLVRILHSPSSPILKGTPQIGAAIERLRAKGYAIEWVTISGQPNEVVLRELAQCDFVVDQLYGDWLMPGFATEAALAGKAAIIGGYDLAALQSTLPTEHRPPVHICHPDDIEAAIEKLIVDKAYRLDLGQRAKAFVEANWSAVKVAERFLKMIEGDIPLDWICDPATIRYFHGGGVSEDRLILFLRAYIEQSGREALQLSDKPLLEGALAEFAASQQDSVPEPPDS